MNVLLFANKHLGAAVLGMLVERGHSVWLVTADAGDICARAAERHGVPVLARPDREPLFPQDLPPAIDLIVSAHSHRILPGWVTAAARVAAIGYHPSWLPAFKGRRAVQDALEAGALYTGGSVYHLTGEIDGGGIVCGRRGWLQRSVRIEPGETAGELWRRALQPLGLALLREAVENFEGA